MGLANHHTSLGKETLEVTTLSWSVVTDAVIKSELQSIHSVSFIVDVSIDAIFTIYINRSSVLWIRIICCRADEQEDEEAPQFQENCPQSPQWHDHALSTNPEQWQHSWSWSCHHKWELEHQTQEPGPSCPPRHHCLKVRRIQGDQDQKQILFADGCHAQIRERKKRSHRVLSELPDLKEHWPLLLPLWQQSPGHQVLQWCLLQQSCLRKIEVKYKGENLYQTIT